MSNEIIKIVKHAQKIKNFECRKGGASLLEIGNLEKKFKISLPESYKYFLEQYGFILWFGDNVLGLVPLDEEYEEEDVIRATENYHQRYDNKDEYQSVPRHGVVINSYDGGGYYFLFSLESDRAGEVGLFLTETFGQEVSSFNSFTDYLSFLVTGSPDPIPAAVDYDKINEILDN